MKSKWISMYDPIKHHWYALPVLVLLCIYAWLFSGIDVTLLVCGTVAAPIFIVLSLHFYGMYAKIDESGVKFRRLLSYEGSFLWRDITGIQIRTYIIAAGTFSRRRYYSRQYLVIYTSARPLAPEPKRGREPKTSRAGEAWVIRSNTEDCAILKTAIAKKRPDLINLNDFSET